MTRDYTEFYDIRTMLVRGELENANLLLQSIINRMKSTGWFKQEMYIPDPFYVDAIDRFSMTLIPNDQDSIDKDEQRGNVSLPGTYFEWYYKTEYDIAASFMHIISHEYCDELWKTCPTPMDRFSDTELDFLEEVYNQRLIQLVMPSVYSKMAKHLAWYDSYRGHQYSVERASMISLLTQQPDVPPDLQILVELHHRLYRNDALSPVTFNWYVAAWDKFLEDDTIKTYANKYVIDYKA